MVCEGFISIFDPKSLSSSELLELVKFSCCGFSGVCCTAVHVESCPGGSGVVAGFIGIGEKQIPLASRATPPGHGAGGILTFSGGGTPSPNDCI